MNPLAPTLFDLALNHFLKRYNARYDQSTNTYEFPFGCDEDGIVTFTVRRERLRTIADLNHYDSLFSELGFLSTP